MNLPSFLNFASAPVRARRDGWTPAVQRRFILLLALGATIGEAARRLGRSRQTAYALRDRDGAREFAAAWDAAVAFAQQRPALRGLPRLDFGLETILVPRFYRGRLVGFVQREDVQGALRTMAMLERVAKDIDLQPHEDWDFEGLVRAAAASVMPEADKADAITV